MPAMDGLNNCERRIQSVLIIGDNRISASMINRLKNRAYEVHQVVTKGTTTSEKDNVHIHNTDLSRTGLLELFLHTKPDLVISTTAGGSYDTQKEILDCAIEAGVTRFMPAEFGHDSLNKKLQDRLPPSREKARVIERLRDLSLKGSLKGRISWTAVATGCQLDHGVQSGSLGFELKWQSATLHGRGDERFAASSTAWLGRVVQSIIEHWDEVQNQYLYAAGVITSANEVIQCLEDASGKHWGVGRSDVEECVQEAERRTERGFPDAGMFLMERSVLYDEALGALQPFVRQDAKVKLGLEGESVEEVIRRVLHDHKHHGNGGCGCD